MPSVPSALVVLLSWARWCSASLMDAFSAAKQQQVYWGLCSTLYPNHIDYPCYDPWKRIFEIHSIKAITVCWLVVTGTLMPWRNCPCWLIQFAWWYLLTLRRAYQSETWCWQRRQRKQHCKQQHVNKRTVRCVNATGGAVPPVALINPASALRHLLTGAQSHSTSWVCCAR